MLLADDSSEIMGSGNLLYIRMWEDAGAWWYSRMHSVKATALLWHLEILKAEIVKAHKK